MTLVYLLDISDIATRDRPPSKPPKRDPPHHPKPEVAREIAPKKDRYSEPDELHHPKHEQKGHDRESNQNH
ncbi:MAG: hypothetical protein ACAF41_29575 [Leptolyngbya sp. BL-A-14]